MDARLDHQVTRLKAFGLGDWIQSRKSTCPCIINLEFILVIQQIDSLDSQAGAVRADSEITEKIPAPVRARIFK